MKRELVMGINAVSGLLEHAPERIVRVWIRPGGQRLDALAQDLRTRGISIQNSDERALERMAGEVRHQGVIAEFQPREPIDDHQLKALVDCCENAPLLLVLDGVQDPHNLGACLRSAAAAGAAAVVIPRDRAAPLTPVARRAAAGAAELIPLAVVANLARALTMLGDQGVWRLGLAAEASDGSLFEADLSGPLALVLGGEEKGLRQLTRKRCDGLIHIPMPGSMESLNVSVAAGVALFEAVRARTAS
jgi:23S rRNA (guanosine2251-2'-O)-methyltransferase